MRNQIRIADGPHVGDAATDPRRWLVLAVTVAAQFMVILDVSVVNVEFVLEEAA